jgi:hypothetical protein
LYSKYFIVSELVAASGFLPPGRLTLTYKGNAFFRQMTKFPDPFSFFIFYIQLEKDNGNDQTVVFLGWNKRQRALVVASARCNHLS